MHHKALHFYFCIRHSVLMMTWSDETISLCSMASAVDQSGFARNFSIKVWPLHRKMVFRLFFRKMVKQIFNKYKYSQCLCQDFTLDLLKCHSTSGSCYKWKFFCIRRERGFFVVLKNIWHSSWYLVKCRCYFVPTLHK